MRFLQAALFVPVLLSVAVLADADSSQEGTVVNSSVELNSQSPPTPLACVDSDLDDLDSLRVQLREIQNKIITKKRAIVAKKGRYDNHIVECADVRCVAKVVGGQARKAAGKLLGKTNGKTSTPVDQKCRPSKPVAKVPQEDPIYINPVTDVRGPSRVEPSSTHIPDEYPYVPPTVLIRTLIYIGWFLLGSLNSFILMGIYFWIRSPRCVIRRAARQIQERRDRRTARHQAFRTRVQNFLPHLAFGIDTEEVEVDDIEEKEELLLESEDNVSTTTMTDDISEFRNAADMVSNLIAAEEGRSTVSSRQVSSPRSDVSSFQWESQHADEQLPPAYEDHDGSSYVSDGFRYSPGSSQYTPSQSGNASDILGPDKP